MKSYVIYGLHGIAKNKLLFQPTPLSLRELWFSFFLLFFMSVRIVQFCQLHRMSLM